MRVSMPWRVDWKDAEIPMEAVEGWMQGCGLFVATSARSLWDDNCKRDWRVLMADRYAALHTIFVNYGVESPIEARMIGLLLWIDGFAFGLPEACHEPWFDDDYSFDDDEIAYSVMPQVKVGEYRADFLILVRGPGGLQRIAVECDGHDFHEKTKEQAARDKKRDRHFQLEGIKVLRFTGSEIYRTPIECVTDIQHAVCQAVVAARGKDA